VSAPEAFLCGADTIRIISVRDISGRLAGLDRRFCGNGDNAGENAALTT